MLTVSSNLQRYPIKHDPTLRAWDAADELVLSELPQNLESKRILIINDAFGALSCALSDFTPISYTDSYVSYKGIILNGFQGKVLNDLDKITGCFDLVIIKLPKNMSFFEDVLCSITNHMTKNAQVICAGMIKHMPKTAFDLLNKYIGETSTSLAKKKARLIYAQFNKEKVNSPYPNKIEIQEWEKPLINHSNLFSRDKLDIGTRFFLENIPSGEYKSILDLGCANGIVGLKAKKINPEARIIFADESFMAIKSAQTNYEQSFDAHAEFTWTNCYEEDSLPKVDLVLCNPPFHQGNTIGDFIAWQMFHDAKRALNKGGFIRVIGNRHLGYHVKLKKIFGNSKVINQNKKFVIIDAYKN